MIQIRNITKKLGTKTILNNVSVDIPTNKLTFISGQSGVGKTTLLHIIAKITMPNSGQISFFDENQKQLKNPNVDIVFQDFNLIDNISAVDNVKIGTNIMGRSFKQEEFIKNANFLNLDQSIFRTKMEDLSGGEKQRIAILRCLNRGSEFILFDEPTAALDKENEIIIFEKIKQMSKTHTIVVISHNIEMVKKYADQIIYLQKHKQPVVEILNNQQEEIESFLPEPVKNRNTLGILQLKNKLSISPTFVIADISKKMAQTILIIIAFLAAIFSISFAFELNSGTDKIGRQQRYTLSLDKNKIEKKSKTPFSEDEIRQINNFNSVNSVVAQQPTTGMSLFFENKRASLLGVEQIEIDQFFKNRIENDLVNFEGRFLESSSEIILANSVIEKLKIKNPIGKTIFLVSGDTTDILKNPRKIPLTIVGVNHGITQTVSRSNFNFNLINFPSFISKQTILDMQDLVAKNSPKPQEKLHLFPEITSYIPSENKQKSALIPFAIQLEKTQPQPQNGANLKLITGTTAKKVDEILISTTAVDSSAKYKLKVGDIVQAKSPLNQKFNLVVVGIFDSKTPELYYHSSAFEYYSRIHPTSLAAYLANTEEENDLDSEAKTAKFDLEITPPSNLIRVITSQSLGIIDIINKVTFAVFIIFVIILIAFILVYAKTVSESKQKMIGILKALGGSTSLTLFYHTLNMLVISFVTLIFSFAIIFPVIKPVHTLVVGSGLPPAPNDLLAMIIFFSWIGLSVVFILIYVLMSLITYKKSTQQLLRN
ncbi:ATP-binding cassette domain-containing protein [Mycoplasma sp. 'Moose RK']|uniref:ATP-binding cassette domain-containing protein n=1 Tax=Mycoplasma sp. 'Moose RK' TaxID=2780095 RepID=UPI0018C2B7A2|nr:ATP-binding cassette domain-containing protein [Mycoplasma sp. 'Moose RK']MBG0731091.1 ATP-binding cassette domain-containing protein [Mycoplasma sp. 'Moose RK']